MPCYTALEQCELRTSMLKMLCRRIGMMQHIELGALAWSPITYQGYGEMLGVSNRLKPVNRTSTLEKIEDAFGLHESSNRDHSM